MPLVDSCSPTYDYSVQFFFLFRFGRFDRCDDICGWRFVNFDFVASIAYKRHTLTLMIRHTAFISFSFNINRIHKTEMANLMTSHREHEIRVFIRMSRSRHYLFTFPFSFSRSCTCTRHGEEFMSSQK